MLSVFYKLMAKYVSETDGVTGLEYGMIAGGVGLGTITAVTLVGDQFSGMFETFGDFLSAPQDL